MSAAPQPGMDAYTPEAALDTLQGGPSDARQQWPIDRSRYRRVVRFFFGVTVHFVWWEIVLRTDSGVLWTDFETYSAAGLGPDDGDLPDEGRKEQDIRNMLLQQSRIMGIAQ